MNTGRDSTTMLSKQLFSSITNIKTFDINDYNKVKDDKLLTKKELNNIKISLKKNKKIKLIKIYQNKKELEHDFVYVDKNGNASVISSILEIGKIFIKHPMSLIESYSSNYCALSSICVIDTKDGVGYWVTKKKNFSDLFENSVIGYRTYSDYDNIFYLNEEKYESAKYYTQQKSHSITSIIIYKLSGITNRLYKFSMLFLPIILLISICFRIVKRKKIESYNLYKFSMIFGLSSLLTLLSCSFVGQIIDRYSVYCFVSSLVCIVSSLVFIFKNIKVRRITE